MSMRKSESVLKFRQIARPKYKEELSGDEAAVFQAWEIMMMVIPSELHDHTYPVYYYIRAQKPDQAAMMAHQLWTQWERTDRGISEFLRYPDIDGAGAGRGLDEKEYLAKWKEAQRYARHRYIGLRENPSAFTFMPPGYDGIGTERKIIVPQFLR